MGYSPESVGALPASIVVHFMFSAPPEIRENYENLAIRCELLARLSRFVFDQAQTENFLYSGGPSETLDFLADFLIESDEKSSFPTENRETLVIAIAKSFPYVEQSDIADILGDELLRTAALKLQARGESIESCFELVDNIEHPDFRDLGYQQLEDNF